MGGQCFGSPGGPWVLPGLLLGGGGILSRTTEVRLAGPGSRGCVQTIAEGGGIQAAGWGPLWRRWGHPWRVTLQCFQHTVGSGEFGGALLRRPLRGQVSNLSGDALPCPRALGVGDRGRAGTVALGAPRGSGVTQHNPDLHGTPRKRHQEVSAFFHELLVPVFLIRVL